MPPEVQRRKWRRWPLESGSSWWLTLLCGSTAAVAVVVPQVLGDRYEEMVKAQQAAKVEIAVLRSVLEEARDIVNVASYEYSSAERRQAFDLKQFGSALIGLNDKFLALQVAPGGVISDQYPKTQGPQIGLDLLHAEGEKELSSSSISQKKIVFRGPLKLVEGGQGIIVRGPVFDESTNRFWGFVGVIVDWSKIFNLSNPESSLHFDYRLIGSTGQPTTAFDSDHSKYDSLLSESVSYDVKLLSGRLIITAHWSAPWRRYWPIYLAQMLSAGVGVGYIVHRLQMRLKGQGLSIYKYRSLFEQSSDALLVLNGLSIETANSAASFLFGVESVSALSGVLLQNFCPVIQLDGLSTREVLGDRIAGLADQETLSFEWAFLNVQDSRQWIGSVVIHAIQMGKRQRVLMRIADLSGLKTAENKVRGMSAKYQAIFEQSVDVVLLMDPYSAVILDANQASLSIYGAVSMDELIGHTPIEFSPEVQPGGKPSLVRAQEVIRDCLQVGHAEFEWLHQRPLTGELWWGQVSLRRVEIDSEISLIVRVRDINEVKKFQDRLTELAYVDELTRLPNRLAACEWLDRVVEAGSWKDLALIAFDIDGFQKINELYGHQFGDQVLLAFCQWLKNQELLDGWQARLGSDSFVVCLHQAQAVDWLKEVKLLLQSLDLTCYLDQQFSLYVTASSGVVLVDPQHLSDPNVWLEQLNTALVKASQSGRSSCVLYDEVLRRNLQSIQDLEQALHFALRDPDQAFSLLYQPQIDHAGVCLGAEALLRLTGPDGQLIPPDRFIPLAETSGRIHEVGAWVVRAAFRQYSEWLQAGLQPGILAINVSATQFEQSSSRESLLGILKSVVREYQINPACIELEITETTAFSDFGKPLRMLQELSDFGFRLAIDDFGTGFAALNHLVLSPVNKIKIDKLFVDGVVDSDRDQVIVSSVCRLAKGLGLDLVAEGVETVEQRDQLLRLGCCVYQGYFFSKPLPPELYRKHYLRA